MINGKIINIFTLGVLNTIKTFSSVELKKSSVYLLKESIPIQNLTIRIKLKGAVNGDILISFNENMQKRLVKDFSNQMEMENSEESDNSMRTSIISEMGNTVAARISSYLSQVEMTSDIQPPNLIEPGQTKELNYENIAVIDFIGSDGLFQIGLGLKELEYQRNLTFMLFGLNSDTVEYITTNYIPRGFEVISSEDPKILAYHAKKKKIDFVLIDFYIIEHAPENFLKSLSSSLDYTLKVVMGVTKLDLTKLKTIKLSTDTYSVIGIYPKTKSNEDILKTMNEILTKTGFKPDDRRKHIRVNINEQNRFFIAFKGKEDLVKARIIDLSLGGIKCILDKEDDEIYVTMGKILNSVDIFLKYQRIITDCTIVSKEKNMFSLAYNNLVENDKETISKVIFRILSTST